MGATFSRRRAASQQPQFGDGVHAPPFKGNTPFQHVPNDLLKIMFDMVDDHDLCRIAETCSTFNVVSTSIMNESWRSRFINKYPQHAGRVADSLFGVTPSAKREYLSTRTQLHAIATSEYHHQLWEWRRDKIGWMMTLSDGPLIYPTISILFLISLITLVLRFRNHASLDIYSVIPIFILLGVLVWTVINVLWSYCESHLLHRSCLCPSTSYAHGRGLIHAIFSEIFASYGPQVICSTCLFLFGILFMIFLLLRVALVLDWHYAYVFIPLWAVFASFLCICKFPVVRHLRVTSQWSDHIYLWLFVWCCILGPLLAFFILACFKLQFGFSTLSPITGISMMIPLFILNFYIVAVMCAISVEEKTPYVCMLWCCCFMPLLIFEILLGLWLDRGGATPVTGENQSNTANMSLSVVFVPIFIFAGICFLGSLFVCAVNWHNFMSDTRRMLLAPRPMMRRNV